MLKENRNRFKALNDFEAGQMDTLKWIEQQLQREIANINNQNTGYFLRETMKDTFYPIKKLIAHDCFNEILNFVQLFKKQIYKKETGVK